MVIEDDHRSKTISDGDVLRGVAGRRRPASPNPGRTPGCSPLHPPLSCHPGFGRGVDSPMMRRRPSGHERSQTPRRARTTPHAEAAEPPGGHRHGACQCHRLDHPDRCPHRARRRAQRSQLRAASGRHRPRRRLLGRGRRRRAVSRHAQRVLRPELRARSPRDPRDLRGAVAHAHAHEPGVPQRPVRPVLRDTTSRASPRGRRRSSSARRTATGARSPSSASRPTRRTRRSVR
jgi:hypothetical protein